MKLIDYSIIIPVHNSAITLKELHNRLVNTIHNLTFEIIFIDDGSIDNSWNEIKDIQQNYQIKAFKLSKNYGQHNATLCGLINSTGKYAITIDDDLQTPPEEIVKLINRMNETNADVIYGISKNLNKNFINKTLKLILLFFTNIFYSQKKEASSFRLINKNIIQNISQHKQSIVSIDEVILWYTANISNTYVEHNVRKYGKSGYSILSIFSIAINVFFNFYSFPLKFIVTIGFYTSLFSILLGLFYLIKKIFFNVAIEGWTSLMVTILFSTGIIVFSIGIISRYVLQILSYQQEKPGFNISEKIGE
ncbi:MAG TPA: glycosyltransferase [Chitinophagales bacterium]|nr:glycosyltransferase [Chitinophagales bacterium]